MLSSLAVRVEAMEALLNADYSGLMISPYYYPCYWSPSVDSMAIPAFVPLL